MTAPDERSQGERSFDELLGKIERREQQARTRAILYTLVPVVVGVLLLSYATWRVQTAEEEVESLRQVADSLREQVDAIQEQVRDSREAGFYVTNGINLYQQGRYGRAVEAYDQALQLDPENAYILNLKGYSLFKADRIGPAVQALQRAVEENPSYAWGYFDLARARCAAEDWEAATQAMERAVTAPRPRGDDARRWGVYTPLRPCLG